VAKYDPQGTHLWSRGFSSNENQRGTAIAVDASQNIVVAGSNTGRVDLDGGPIVAVDEGDAFVVKLGPAGNHIWSRGLDAMSDDEVRSIAVDGAGAVVLAGTSRRSPLLADDHDVFVAKLDGASGATASITLFGDERRQSAGGMALAPGGELLLAGGFEGELDLGAGTLTEHGRLDVFAAKLILP
jgi:hypothetical protein